MLDIKIFRALVTESAVAPSSLQVNSSVKSIAARLRADDATVAYRYKRMQETGALSGWQLMVNPTFFGCRMVDVMVDAQPETGKPDMIRKLKLVHEVVGIIDFYGKAMRATVMYNGEESRSRAIELICRVTNSETVAQIVWALPRCRTERMTETDVAIIRSLSNDARKSFVQVAKELGLSTRTVRNHVLRLRRENTVFSVAILNLGVIPGLIPVVLSYSYARDGVKGTVDRAVLSHFERSYFWGGFADPSNGSILLGASTMADVQDCLEWARSQPGIAAARTDILLKMMMLPEKLIELLGLRNERAAVQEKAFF